MKSFFIFFVRHCQRSSRFGVVLGSITLTLLTFAHLFSQSTPLLPIADTYVASGRPTASQPADLRVVWVGYNQVDSYG